MVIRKQFTFEGSHIVRNCSSERCKKSIHGHSNIVEIFLTSDKLDNGQMIIDFGLLKFAIKDFIDSFDHAYSLWRGESQEFKDNIKKFSARWIEMPVSPTAESYSLMFLYAIDNILAHTQFKNGEGYVKVVSVRVHETATGYAEAFRKDLDWVKYNMHDIIFSEDVMKDWGELKSMYLKF